MGCSTDQLRLCILNRLCKLELYVPVNTCRAYTPDSSNNTPIADVLLTDTGAEC
jgi:hypothetical protein